MFTVLSHWSVMRGSALQRLQGLGGGRGVVTSVSHSSVKSEGYDSPWQILIYKASRSKVVLIQD